MSSKQILAPVWQSTIRNGYSFGPDAIHSKIKEIFGVSFDKISSAMSVMNDADFIRSAQRFPVVVEQNISWFPNLALFSVQRVNELGKAEETTVEIWAEKREADNEVLITLTDIPLLDVSRWKPSPVAVSFIRWKNSMPACITGAVKLERIFSGYSAKVLTNPTADVTNSAFRLLQANVTSAATSIWGTMSNFSVLGPELADAISVFHNCLDINDLANIMRIASFDPKATLYTRIHFAHNKKKFFFRFYFVVAGDTTSPKPGFLFWKSLDYHMNLRDKIIFNHEEPV